MGFVTLDTADYSVPDQAVFKVLEFTGLCFLFKVCDTRILVYSFIVTLIVCIEHVSFPSNVRTWDTVTFEFG